jgi:hypothetical protein
MAFYRFQFHSRLGAQAVLERIQSLTRDPPGFGQSFKESFGWRPAAVPPFIGKAEGSNFNLHRDIRYRNSFLPRIRGHIDVDAEGTRIDVTMHLHPFAFVFMLFWLGGVGLAGIAMLSHGRPPQSLIPLGMFAFGVALTLGGFFPEAFKARRLLEQGIGE